MVKKYRVGLTGEEQEELRALVSKGRAAAYKQTHARILLLSDGSGEPASTRVMSRSSRWAPPPGSGCGAMRGGLMQP